MHNKIDTKFYSLMEFIKDRDLNQMEEVIIQNFNYLKKTNYPIYNNIVNYYNKYKLWGQIDLNTGNHELIENNAKSLVEHREDFEWLYEHLGDYRSKKILTAILYYWMSLDFKMIEQLEDKTYDQYFDLDLIKCNKNEVFVDIGGYIGDTIISYINTYGIDNYKKIYCYEIVPVNIKLFNLKNIIIKKKGAASKKEPLYLSNDDLSSTATLSLEGKTKVKTCRIDEDIKEKVTFIKMDIEGAEEDALLGCHDTILKDHPKLALAVYHNNDHLWTLAKIIYEIDPTYRFYLRYYGSKILPLEYILYAI